MRTVFGSTAAPTMRAFFTFVLSLVMIACFQISVVSDADARKRKSYKRGKVVKKSATRSRANPRFAAFVMDAKTGKVLHSRYANAKRYPASLTKMMTLYLIFEDLKSGRIKKSSRLVMTKAGARRPPSKLGLRVGQSISMEQAIYSLVTKSANDVATAVGDKLAGSEKAFAKRMTLKARQLGMMNTTFKNASGLTERGQLTTASDMAKLGLALREHFPRRYKYFQTRVFKLGKRRYRNHNRLLGRVRGVDGIKTGYTRASGFNLVSSVSSGGRRIVAVVMGGRSGASRNAHMTKLIRGYLPKASRGKGRRLIAAARSSRKGGTFKVAKSNTFSVAKKASKKIASRIETAHNVKVPTQKDIALVRNRLASMASATTPIPSLRKSLTPSKKKALDKKSTAAITKEQTKKGWQIQIAASDDQKKARAMLNKAQAKNKSLLGNKSAVTLAVVKNGSRFYRARFVGFSSKSSARRACQILKKQRYACLALNG